MMKEENYTRKAAGVIALGWLIFLGIDFLFHASLLQAFWDDKMTALLDPMTLFKRIPFGYASFLLLTLLLFYLMTRIYGRFPAPKEGFRFGLIFGGLFSLSNGMGLYSYIDLPVFHLLLFNLVYFIELTVVSWFMAYILRRLHKKTVFASIGVFLLMLATGILFQNLG